ncbi:unnamed protein product [Pylaiella littoralis]
MKKFRRSTSRSFVLAREELYETKLESANLRENLVHEEFRVDVFTVYDFSYGKDAKEVGGFGEVQAVTHRKTAAKYAMKTVKLSSVKSQKAFEFVTKEVDLLKSLDHPNIVRLQEVYMSDSHLYMAMDLIAGGNLGGSFRCDGEEQAAVIVRQIVRALRYLHDRHIAHRDLKLENILIEAGDAEGNGTPTVKLVDFGLSAIYQENGVSTDVLGSWNYVAPEVINGQYRPAPADMWSLGVVTYVLMSGALPFDTNSTEGIKRNIMSAKVHFKEKAWVRASEASRHFVRSLLLKSPHLRLTTAGAQKHEWLRGAEDLSQTPQQDARFREEVTQSMLNFREADPMKQLALEVVARTLDPAQIRLLSEEFDRADKNNNGEVSLSEFKVWLEANGAARGMSEQEVEALFKSVDVDHSGLIHFNEFLAATIQQRHMDRTVLRPAFDRLDRSHTGFINLQDVTFATGAAANMEESAAMLAHFDQNGDGQISFEEFVNGMRRMGGSGRDGAGLLSALPAPAADTQVADADGAGASGFRNPSSATAAVDQTPTTVEADPVSEPKPQELESPTASGSSGLDANVGEAADGCSQALNEIRHDEAVAPAGRGSRVDGEDSAAARAAAKASEKAGEVSKKEGVLRNGIEFVEPSRRQVKSSGHRSIGEGEKAPRLDRQGCGCVVA